MHRSNIRQACEVYDNATYEERPLQCGLEPALFDRQYELYEYDGLLFLEDAMVPCARSFLATTEFPIAEIDGRTIEINYSGRDANRWLVSWLKQLARTVEDATGEITCTITTDEGGTLFEFFRISAGKLVRQRGAIVRNDPEWLV